MVFGNDRGAYSVNSVGSYSYPMYLEKQYDAGYEQTWNFIIKSIEKLNGVVIIKDKEGGVISFSNYKEGSVPDNFLPFKRDKVRWKCFTNIYVKEIEERITKVWAVYYITMLYSVNDKKYVWYDPGVRRRSSCDRDVVLPSYLDVEFFYALDMVNNASGE